MKNCSDQFTGILCEKDDKVAITQFHYFIHIHTIFAVMQSTAFLAPENYSGCLNLLPDISHSALHFSTRTLTTVAFFLVRRLNTSINICRRWMGGAQSVSVENKRCDGTEPMVGLLFKRSHLIQNPSS